MWEQSLQGLIKALRASKNAEDRVIRAALDDIAGEIRQSDWEVKAGAVLKLIYLEMLGHPHLAQHAFPVIECMSSSRFHLKQIGYLAASQSFREGTEVILLTNNLIKKDLTTPAPTPTLLLLTLSSLPNLLLSSPQLVTDLHPELVRQLTSSRPVIRRAALLVLGKLWTSRSTASVPFSHEQITEKIRERLADDDISVVSSAINVLLELTTAGTSDDAMAYLALAPELFDLLTSSSNNWMLIKIIKIFTVLTPLEPRLVRKLLPPLRHLISTTPAMSLLYECINAVIVGGMLEGEGGGALAGTCVDKLAAFLEDVDQNLRYMALLALVRLLPSHPSLVARHYDEILQCVGDADATIRTQALHLVDGMVDRSNLQDIVSQLLRHLRSPARRPTASTSAVDALALASRGDPSSSSSSSYATSSASSPLYRRALCELIVAISTRSTYANVSNFPWLIDTICSLSSIALTVPGLHEDLLSSAIVDIAVRARAVRPYMAKKMSQLLRDDTFRTNAVEMGGAAAGVLHAAAWIIGEYASELQDPNDLLDPLFDADVLLALPPTLATTVLHNGVKLVAYIATCDEETFDPSPLSERVLPCLRVCARSKRGDVELLERASQLEAVLSLFLLAFQAYKPAPKAPEGSEEWANGHVDVQPRPSEILRGLFAGAYELNPVSAKAQSLVAPPEDLDLDSWIVSSAANLGADWEQAYRVTSNIDVDEYGRPRASRSASNAEVEDVSDDRPRRKKGKEKRRKKGALATDDIDEKDMIDVDRLEEDIDSIPVIQLDLDLGSQLAPPSRRGVRVKTPKPRSPTPPPIFIDVEGELPPEALQRSRIPSAVPKAEEPVSAIEETPEQEVVADAPVVKVVKVRKKDKDASKKRKTNITVAI